MLARFRDAYRRWRYRRLCNTVRETMFALTGDSAILDLSDEELQEGVETIREAVREAGVSFEEAVKAIGAFTTAYDEAMRQDERCDQSVT